MSIQGQRCGGCKYWQPSAATSTFKCDLPDTTTLNFVEIDGVPGVEEVKSDRNDWGFCQRRSPVVHFDKKISLGIFPSSHRDQWCGEFETSPYAKYKIAIKQLYENQPELFQGLSDGRIKLLIESLHKVGVVTVGNWLMRGDFQLLRTPNLGRKGLHLINQAIASYVENEDGIKLDLY